MHRISRNSWGAPPEALRTIYSGAICPILLYNCSVWADGLKFKYNRKLICSIQRQFAIRIAKAYKTISHESALTLALLEPLTDKIKQISSLYEIKHKTHVYLDNKKHHIEQPLNEGHKLPSYKIKLPTEQPVTYNEVAIYTDGSKIDGKTGAGFCVMKEQRVLYTKQIKLGNLCSVYQAELIIIKESLKFIIDYFQRTPSDNSTVNIYTDSKSAQYSILDINSRCSITAKIHRLINELYNYTNNISLFWVRIHQGVAGNEMDTKLPKQQRFPLQNHYTKKSPLSYFKHNCKEALQIEL